jgi:hypothetical protein
LSKKAIKKSDDEEIREIFGDSEIYENAPPSPIMVQKTPAPSPTGSLEAVAGASSPESPQVDSNELVIDENDVIKKFTIKKSEIKVALEKPKVIKITIKTYNKWSPLTK